MNRRSLVLAAGLAAAAAGAAPAIASADVSNCTYLPSSKTVFVYDHSGFNMLRLFRTGEQIRIDDGNTPAGRFCPVQGGGLTVATVSNTDKVVIWGSAFDSGSQFSDGYLLDQRSGAFSPGATPESDGYSEIEVQVNTGGAATNSWVFGTPGDDEIRAGKAGAVNLRKLPVNGTDNDDDITFSTPPKMLSLSGEGGDDLLSGNRNEMTGGAPNPSDVSLSLLGGDDNDLLIGGGRQDLITGGGGDDYMDAFDGAKDGPEFLYGQDGVDTAVIDKGDGAYNTETIRVGPVFGRGAVKGGPVQTRAGEPTRVRIGWSHHQGWKQLRSLKLRVAEGGRVLRTVKASADLSHNGKWLWADATLRPSREMVGRNLQLQVVATDVHGRTAVEPLAGTLAVR